jgi:hypothetical protein
VTDVSENLRCIPGMARSIKVSQLTMEQRSFASLSPDKSYAEKEADRFTKLAESQVN